MRPLLLSNFQVGWEKYEWRWQTEMLKDTRRHFPPAPWLGKENLKDKTILLHAEQGFGDTLQFARFVPLVADRGATVLLEVQGALKNIFQNFKGTKTVFAQGEPLPHFDYHCPLLSLPLALNQLAPLPTEQPYLKADPARLARWAKKLGERTRPRAGLVWSGSTIHKSDRNRSIALKDFTQVLLNNVEFFCLQKDIRDTDRDLLKSTPRIVDLSAQLTDFSDTAAVIELLDVVITVDTSVAHLAGALGKPVWVLLPFAPDWRWLINRNDTDWYRQAKLFRQPKLYDWSSVLNEVRQALIELGA